MRMTGILAALARPDFDASLQALQPVLAGQQPVIMQANTEREIVRALDLAREFNLRPIIAGGAEAYKVTARLKAENVPVLLSLSFPRAGAAPAGGGRGGAVDPADPEPLRHVARPRHGAEGSRHPGQGRRQVRVRVRRRLHEHDRQPAQGRRRGTTCRPGAQGADLAARRTLRRQRSPRQHRDRQDRQPHHHQGRTVRSGRPRDAAVCRRQAGVDHRTGRAGRRRRARCTTWRRGLGCLVVDRVDRWTRSPGDAAHRAVRRRNHRCHSRHARVGGDRRRGDQLRRHLLVHRDRRAQGRHRTGGIQRHDRRERNAWPVERRRSHVREPLPARRHADGILHEEDDEDDWNVAAR